MSVIVSCLSLLDPLWHRLCWSNANDISLTLMASILIDNHVKYNKRFKQNTVESIPSAPSKKLSILFSALVAFFFIFF